MSGKTGAYAWKADFTSEYQNKMIRSSETGIDPFLGFVLKGKVNRHFSLGVQATRYFISLNDVTYYSAVIEYNFTQ
ncbi:hypothetical protein VCR12J2_620119 [Vibrio coralliirubri]|uniref:hypothetical protein n=1 Tax=Vibrio coralliirubri TaxID=1516159 RepID=UPI000635A9F8|nr:hypothetical protein [Vibrio coralliirubri]CDT99640.1 hypothetical protein VCR12J2_620119 [Vibrio coralliirubri]